MKIEALEEKVRQAASPALTTLGVDLVAVEMFSQNSRLTLRVTIDSPDGVNVDDCAKFSRQLSDILDVEDFIQPAYVLEVSSPGINRPLKMPPDYLWAVGKNIRLTARRLVDGKNNVLTGRLAIFENDMVSVETGDGMIKIALADVAKARVDGGDLFAKGKKAAK